MKTNSITQEKKFRTGLLYVVLFLNVFAFSGYADSSGVKLQPQSKIEWVFASGPEAKRTVSYKSAYLFHTRNKTVVFCKTEFRKALIIFDNLVKTKIALLLKQTFSFSLPIKFFCLKAFPPRLAEALPSSSLG